MKLTAPLLALLILLTGCNTLPVVDGQKEEIDLFRKQLLGEMPLPLGAKIDNEASLILGNGENWTGRVILSVSMAAAETFNTLREQFQGGGWTLLSSVKAKNSILVFTRFDRTVTLEINEAGLTGGSRIVLSVAPRNNALPPVRKP